jgi:hypothetical protein
MSGAGYPLAPDDQFDPNKWRYLRQLQPSVPGANLNSGGSAFGQGDGMGLGSDQDASWAAGRWLGDTPNANAFNLTSSGPAGQGESAQPEVSQRVRGPSAAAGRVLKGASMPPPGTATPAPSPVESAPPDTSEQEFPQDAAFPSQQAAGEAPSATDQLQKRIADRANNPPTLKTNWAQRLALTVLSLSPKLAPYANQIVHPKYTEQMAAYQAGQQGDTSALNALEKAGQIEDLGQQRQEKAAQLAAQAANYPAALAEKAQQALQKQQDAEDASWLKGFGIQAKGRESDVQVLPERSPMIAQLQAKGYTAVKDPTYRPPDGEPGMVRMIPPAFIQLGQDDIPVPGYKVGDLVPWSDHRSALANYYKQQQEVALEQAKAQYAAPKTTTPEQQYMDEYIAKHPGADKAAAIRAYAQDSQRPPEPPQALMIGPDGRAMAVRPGSQVPQGSQTPAGVNTVSTPTSQSRSMAEMANTVTQQVPSLLGQIDALKQKIGPAAGRWNQLWTNHAGFNDPDFAGLDQDLDLFASALVRTHFGGRGGQGYREALKKNFTEAQSPDDLKARIQHAETWLQGYANIANKPGAAGAVKAAPIVQHSPSTGQYRYSIDGGKTWQPGQPPNR